MTALRRFGCTAVPHTLVLDSAVHDARGANVVKSVVHARSLVAPVKDVEDKHEHVGHNGQGHPGLEIQPYHRLPHHQLPKLAIEDLQTTSSITCMQPT